MKSLKILALIFLFIISSINSYSVERQVQPIIEKDNENTKFIIWEIDSIGNRIPRYIKWNSALLRDTNKRMNLTYLSYPQLDSIEVNLIITDFTSDKVNDFIFDIQGYDSLTSSRISLSHAIAAKDSLIALDTINIGTFNSNLQFFTNQERYVVETSEVLKNKEYKISKLSIDKSIGIIDTSTSVLSEKGLSNDIKVYPNPTSSTLNIVINLDVQQLFNSLEIDLVNLDGQILNRIITNDNIINPNKMDMKSYPVGTYYLLIRLDNKLIQIEKIIKI